MINLDKIRDILTRAEALVLEVNSVYKDELIEFIKGARCLCSELEESRETIRQLHTRVLELQTAKPEGWR